MPGLAGAIALAASGASWAQCSGDFSEELTLDWNSISPALTAGSNYSGSATIAASQGDVTVGISITNTGTWNGSGTGAGGGRPGLDAGNLALGGTFGPSSEQITVGLTFENANGDPLPVENIELTAYDIDRYLISIFGFTIVSYRDQATISAGTWTPGAGWTGTGGGTSTVTAPEANTGASPCDGLSTNSACSAAASTGTGSAATSFTLTYRNALSSATNPFQEIALTDVTFCVDPDMVPVTIASVDPRQEGGDLVVGWTTTMEQANAGFHVLGDLGDRWERLNADLIPSQAVDADAPLSYSARFPAVTTDRILIEDVDIRGRTQRHGPFEVGRRHGADPEVQRVDLAAIRAANAAPAGIAPMLATAFSLETVGAGAGAGAGADAARLSVTRPGIQRVAHADLLAAGVDLTGKSVSAIGIADNGRAVSRYVDDANGNEIFDAGDAIEFVGEVELTLYSDANLYVLTSDGSKVAGARELAPSARGDVARTYTASYRAYPDNRYSASAPVGSIPWYDGLVRAIGKPSQLARTFDLPDLDAAAATGAALTIDLWGLSDLPGADDHHAVVSLNGVEIADTRFDGLVLDRIAVDLDTGILRAAGNDLVVSLPFDTGHAFDFVGLDGFALSYPAFAQARDGTWTGELPAGGAAMAVDGFADCAGLHLWGQHGNRPYRLTGLATEQTATGCQVTLPSRRNLAVRYWLADMGAAHQPAIAPGVPERTARASWRTEYLIITHPLFADSLGALVALQESRGLTTEVVTTDAIYAAYSDHQRDADALQAFIRNSAERRSSRLRYLLLVGGDTPDYFNIRGAEALTLVPTRYAKVGDLIHFAPTDVPYGDLDADGLPDIPAGRLIARTIPELEALVAKLTAYSGARSGLFVTGRSDSGNGFAEQHEAMSQVLADSGWELADLAVDDYVEDGLAIADARADLLDQLQGGHSLVSYLGHSDYDYWDFGPLFHRNDIASLPFGSPTFVVTQWGCWNSYFVAITIETMAHSLLLTEGKGAASLIGSSSLTSLAAHDAIGKRFFDALSQGPIALGDALLRAQREAVAQSDSFRDDILAMVLLGDPALVVGH